MPNLFAQVGSTYENVTEKATNAADGLGGENLNLIPNSDSLRLWNFPGDNDKITLQDGWSRTPLPTTAMEYGHDSYADVEPNTEYTQSLYIRTDADRLVDPMFSFFWPGAGPTHQYIDTTVTEVSEGLWHVVGTGVTKDGQNRMRVPDIFVEFEGGTYAEFGRYQLVEES